MDEHHLLANHNTTETKESFSRTDNDNEEFESSEYSNGLRSRHKRGSFLGTLWAKHSLMIALVLSIMANTFFGLMFLVLMNSLKWQNKVKSGPPDISLNGKFMIADGCAKTTKFQPTAI